VIPRLVIAGTSSGAGKTTIATGLLAALRSRGAAPAGFKVGPDFIDPSYHALATGRPGRNLDGFMSGPGLIAPLFRHGSRDAQIAVIEGVMGLYDGASGRDELASTAHVAKLLQAPVVLVVDAAAMARSVAAIVHGYASFDPEVAVKGVILNRVGSDAHSQLLREALAPLGIPVLGAIQRDDGVATPERHLGLVPAGERELQAREAIDRLAAVVARSCDLDGLVELARSAPDAPGPRWSPEPHERHPGRTRIAIADGPAFSFRYEENLELLRAAGAELAPFDPLEDEQLPPRTAALLLTGGFPEVYGAELSENWALRAEIAAFARAGRPVLAECGGLLYLCSSLDGRPMCDVIDAEATMTDRLTLGYREATSTGEHPLWPASIAAPAPGADTGARPAPGAAPAPAPAPAPSAGAGRTIRGHEFHYSRVHPSAGQRPAWQIQARAASRSEGHVDGGVHASYLHTHWAATPEVGARLVALAAGAREVVA
jgi:cobyrinic acid a,c-diamide synthase